MFEKLQKAVVSPSFLSVHLHETTWLPLVGFSLNLLFENFLTISQEN
jgi:hypothetical protein